MWFFWTVPVGTPAYDTLIYHRWQLVLYSISSLSMAIVLVRTYKHSKYPYLSTCAAMMCLSALFQVIDVILINWEIGCKYYSV